jgi:hypothetical protein
MPDTDQRLLGAVPLSRRGLLTLLSGAGAAAVLAGCSSAEGGGLGRAGGSSCAARSSLDSHDTLNRLPLVYEVSERRTSFAFDPGFYTQLGRWLTGYAASSGLAEPDEVWSYGAWTDGGTSCDSWHNSGRAFDLGRLRLADGGVVSCRYDLWRSDTGARRERALRRYWALAASLHQDFAYVLTYPYNARHHNHIHVDNGRSGSSRSTLSTRSPSQLQAVQAICTHLWDEPVDITGAWDRPTRAATRRVLDRIGEPDHLDDSVKAWRAFLSASVPRGAG